MKPGSLISVAAAMLAYAIALQSLVAEGQQPVRVGEEPEHVIGIVHREIAESSSFASPTISAQDIVKAGTPETIHFAIENRSDHDLVVGGVVLDSRDGKGALLPETELGCTAHFFSPCYKYKNLGSGPTLTLSAHKSYKWDSLLNTDYDLNRPGTYTIVGYVQISVDSKNSNFKTNKIKITVQ